jgi:hypothetical protein
MLPRNALESTLAPLVPLVSPCGPFGVLAACRLLKAKSADGRAPVLPAARMPNADEREQFDTVDKIVQQLMETAPVVRTFNVHTSTPHKVAAEKTA